MIARIRGIFSEAIDEHRVIIEVSGIYYEILLPAIVMKELRDRHEIGDEVTFSTLYEIEGSAGFGNLTPRLIGFLRDRDKKFFERLVKVKDFGARRAMKSLTVPFSDVAAAIERADISFMTTLPEIGKRTAEKIIAELKGKLGEFVSGEQPPSDVISEESMPDFKREAVVVLLQLGYKQTEARIMVNRAMLRNPEITSSEELVKEVFAHQKNE
jgi:Holliday junction DNA helicase RuvA